MASVPAALLDAAAASSRPRGGPRRGGPPRRDGPRPANDRQQTKRRNLEPVAEDETGIIESLMDGFGFIKCADRDISLFFHFSEIKDHTKPPEVGDELQFAVVRDKDEHRERATRIDVLPKGSVVFEVVETSSVHGAVTAPLQFNKTKRKEGFGGRITLNSSPQKDSRGKTNSENNTTLIQEESKAEVYEFSERDVVDPRVPLREGDEVEFDIFVEKRTGKTGATRISLIRPCPTGRVRGVVNNVVKSDNGGTFGFIDVEDDDRSLYFPMVEVLDAKATLTEGSELEFAIAKDRSGKDRAVSISVLPTGSVKVWKVLPGNKLEGVISVELPPPAQRGPGKQNKGQIEVTNEDGSKEMVAFGIEDIHMKTRKRLLKGDGVKLRIATRGTNEPKRGRDIELVRETETDREKGVVVPGKASSDRIWISCESRRTAVSMSTAEVSPEVLPRLKPGAELEVTVVNGDGPGRHPIAIRPKELPKGSVVLVEIGTEVLEGVVTKELTKKSKFQTQTNYDLSRGTIRVGGEEKKSTLYFFGEGDVGEDEKIGVSNLFVGDKVKFRLKLDKQTKRHSATAIQLVAMNDRRVQGVVTKDTGSVGKVMASFPGLQLQFNFNSVLEPTIPLQVGDCVEFDLRKDGPRDYVARLSRLPAGSVTVEDKSSIVKGVVESVGKEGGTIVVEGEGPFHPASLSVPVIPKTEQYKAENLHPAALYLARGRNGTLGFWHDDVRPEGRALTLSKGDAVNLVICSHVNDPMCRRAVQVSTRPKSSLKKAVPVVSTRRSMGPGSNPFQFLRTSQIEALQKGRTMPGDGTDEETDESGDSGSKADED